MSVLVIYARDLTTSKPTTRGTGSGRDPSATELAERHDIPLVIRIHADVDKIPQNGRWHPTIRCTASMQL